MQPSPFTKCRCRGAGWRISEGGVQLNPPRCLVCALDARKTIEEHRVAQEEWRQRARAQAAAKEEDRVGGPERVAQWCGLRGPIISPAPWCGCAHCKCSECVALFGGIACSQCKKLVRPRW
jgi:hypothetical protein